MGILISFYLVLDCDIFQFMDTFENQQFLLELANAKMPFGKYSGSYLTDLPEPYLLWFKGKGFPEGLLGRQLESILEIKLNGLEGLLRPLRRG